MFKHEWATHSSWTFLVINIFMWVNYPLLTKISHCFNTHEWINASFGRLSLSVKKSNLSVLENNIPKPQGGPNTKVLPRRSQASSGRSEAQVRQTQGSYQIEMALPRSDPAQEDHWIMRCTITSLVSIYVLFWWTRALQGLGTVKRELMTSLLSVMQWSSPTGLANILSSKWQQLQNRQQKQHTDSSPSKPHIQQPLTDKPIKPHFKSPIYLYQTASRNTARHVALPCSCTPCQHSLPRFC